MSEILIQTSQLAESWFLIGWVGSVVLLLVGYAIGALYYDDDETPPDVDKSPEGGKTKA